MNTSKLDTRITIIQPLASKSPMGGDVVVEEVRGRLWAGFRYLKGREFTEAQAKNNQSEAVFTVRASNFTKSIKESWLIRHGDETWEILNLTPLPGIRPVKFEITAKVNR